MLYSLKLLDEGLNTEGVTAVGLLSNAEDCADKARRYVKLVDDEAEGRFGTRGGGTRPSRAVGTGSGSDSGISYRHL